MTAADITARINEINTKLIPAQQAIITEAQKHINAINKVRWGGGICSSKNKRHPERDSSYLGCVQDNKVKDGEVAAQQRIIDTAKTTIDSYRNELTTLNTNLLAAQATDSKVDETLAGKGLTRDSALETAKQSGITERQFNEIHADTIDKGLQAQTEIVNTEVNKKKAILIGGIAGGTLLLGVILFFLIKKLRKKQK